jgi:hypothetical protein
LAVRARCHRDAVGRQLFLSLVHATRHTPHKAVKYNSDPGKMAEQDNGYVPDLPDQPVFR